MSAHTFQRTSLDLLVTVTDRSKADPFTAFYRAYGLHFNLVSLARGTAPTELLEYLGLGDKEKALILSTLPSKKTAGLLGRLEEELSLKKPGHGIAFTLSVSSAAGAAALSYLMGNEPKLKEDVGMEEQKVLYDLIVCVVDRGFADPVTEAAREAGASGGTVVYARGAGVQEAETFFGVSIQPEKELILTLVPHSLKKAVMQNIYDRCGFAAEGKGLCFALPVGEAIGLAPAKQGFVDKESL